MPKLRQNDLYNFWAMLCLLPADSQGTSSRSLGEPWHLRMGVPGLSASAGEDGEMEEGSLLHSCFFKRHKLLSGPSFLPVCPRDVPLGSIILIFPLEKLRHR